MTFSLDASLHSDLTKWLNVHDLTCRYAGKEGAIGGKLTFCFTPMSLGTVIKVSCACGAEHDLTDYDW